MNIFPISRILEHEKTWPAQYKVGIPEFLRLACADPATCEMVTLPCYQDPQTSVVLMEGTLSDNDGYVMGFPLGDWTSTPALPFPLNNVFFDRLPDLLSDIRERVGAPVVFETFTVNEIVADQYKHCALWVNSPVVRLTGDHDAWLASLTHKRRYRVQEARILCGQLTDSFSEEPPSDDAIEWMRANLIKKHDDPQHLSGQLLQVYLAVGQSLGSPGSVLWEYLKKGDRLYSVSAFMCTGGKTWNYHYAVYDQNVQLPNGIGTYALDRAIQVLPSKAEIFDPTCRMGPEDNSFDTYKRHVVNEDCLRPAFLGGSEDWQVPEGAEPPYLRGRVWTRREGGTVYGKGL